MFTIEMITLVSNTCIEHTTKAGQCREADKNVEKSGQVQERGRQVRVNGRTCKSGERAGSDIHKQAGKRVDEWVG